MGWSVAVSLGMAAMARLRLVPQSEAWRGTAKLGEDGSNGSHVRTVWELAWQAGQVDAMLRSVRNGTAPQAWTGNGDSAEASFGRRGGDRCGVEWPGSVRHSRQGAVEYRSDGNVKNRRGRRGIAKYGSDESGAIWSGAAWQAWKGQADEGAQRQAR